MKQIFLKSEHNSESREEETGQAPRGEDCPSLPLTPMSLSSAEYLGSTWSSPGRAFPEESGLCPRGSGAVGQTTPQQSLDNATDPTTGRHSQGLQRGYWRPVSQRSEHGGKGVSQSTENLQIRKPGKNPSRGRASIHM